MSKKNKLFVHTLLENHSVKRKVSFYVPENTLNLMLQFNRKPILRIAKKIVEILQENYEEFKSITPDELEKKLYEPVQ